MNNPNKNRLIAYAIILCGLLVFGISAVTNGVEPLAPLGWIGVILAFGGIAFGIAAVRCPHCHARLHLNGITADEYCPHCGEKID